MGCMIAMVGVASLFGACWSGVCCVATASHFTLSFGTGHEPDARKFVIE